MRVPSDVLGTVVKLARERKNMKAEVLAERLGIGLRHLSAIETGKGKPSYAVLINMVRILELPTEAIFYPEQALSALDMKREQLLHAVKTCDDKTVDILYATYNAIEGTI